MNRKLLVLGCSQTKRDAPGGLPAIDRYDGSAYRVLRNYLRGREWPDTLSVAVLSAKYGLVGGFTEIVDYDERMTAPKAAEWAPRCTKIMEQWAQSHSSVHFSLGKDYLPAISKGKSRLSVKSEIFEGPIGMKLSQIKGLLERTKARPRPTPKMPSAGSGEVTYFLPDWDDLLDPDFDFDRDSFSGSSRQERKDKHCCVLMKPRRMCDGVLVSLAQQMTTKGPLRRCEGSDPSSLAPPPLRTHFGLRADQALFGDCGAFSYSNEDEPTMTVDNAVASYELHGFDYGASVDHIPLTHVIRNGKKVELSKAKRSERVKITIRNAERFYELSRNRGTSFRPVGTIQGLSAKGYASAVRHYHEIGYEHIALGGLVPLSDSVVDEIVSEVMRVVSSLNPRPWVHLFGIFRPKMQAKFRNLRVDSFDSATYFRKAWLRSSQNYLGANGQWYAALRVPMTSDARTRKRMEAEGLDLAELEAEEQYVLKLLHSFDQDRVGVIQVLNALMDYDGKLQRSSEITSMKPAYKKTLEDRPWRQCTCPFCTGLGIHIATFRGSNRNKRRGAHNTLMLYQSLQSR